jgi:hypothetical protein
MVGFMIYESWSSPVEDALEARLRQSAGLAAHVEQVQCTAAAAGTARCDVDFVSGTKLERVALSMPASRVPFPAAFTVDRDRREHQLLRVRSPYDGKAMAFEAGARALQASVDAVTQAANKQLGPQLRQGLNALSYERAAEAAGRSGEIVALERPGAAALEEGAVPEAQPSAEGNSGAVQP